MNSASIVIVNWNAVELLPDCLASLAEQRDVELREVIVVDNDSSDGSVEWLEARKPEYAFNLIVISNSSNVGFGAANNQGAARATGEFLVLLNPDTEMADETCLATMCRRLEDAGVGLVGPRLVNPDRSTQRSCAAFPTILNSAMLATGVYRFFPQSLRQRFTPGEWIQDRSALVDWVGGACLCFRRSTYEAIGGFSEATFMYGEDMEIAYDVRLLGLRTFYESAAEVVHHDDYSANKRWNAPERITKVARGELVFLKRHYSAWRRLSIRTVTAAGSLARWFVHVLRRDPRAQIYCAKAVTYIRGV